jgi:hypothetical protein
MYSNRYSASEIIAMEVPHGYKLRNALDVPQAMLLIASSDAPPDAPDFPFTDTLSDTVLRFKFHCANDISLIISFRTM